MTALQLTAKPQAPDRWTETELDFAGRPMALTVGLAGDAVAGVRFGLSADNAAWIGAAPRDDDALAGAIDQLHAYAAGTIKDFDLELRLGGTDFQLAVWRALLDIPYGATSSYGRVAAAIGRPSASRAVGAAVGSNPIAIVVPCHRVIGSDGSLTGFGGGLGHKVALLAREGVVTP